MPRYLPPSSGLGPHRMLTYSCLRCTAPTSSSDLDRRRRALPVLVREFTRRRHRHHRGVPRHRQSSEVISSRQLIAASTQCQLTSRSRVSRSSHDLIAIRHCGRRAGRRASPRAQPTHHHNHHHHARSPARDTARRRRQRHRTVQHEMERHRAQGHARGRRVPLLGAVRDCSALGASGTSYIPGVSLSLARAAQLTDSQRARRGVVAAYLPPGSRQ